MRRVAFGMLLGVLAGCGGQPAAPPASGTLAPAELRVGELTVRATTLPTAQLNEAMARQYGVTRDPGSVLLVVGLRNGPASAEVSVPATVTAQATDLLGKRQDIALREVRTGAFIDYVGVAFVSMPDTLQFTVAARPQGGQPATLRFNRDFSP